jgi:hypothetical protein
MKITATATFRHMHDKGDIITRGTEVDVDDAYGQSLIQSGLAVSGKMLEEYNNKMLKEFVANKMPAGKETAAQRTEGHTGPGPNSETPEERSQGYSQPDEKGRKDEEKTKIADFPEGEPIRKPPQMTRNERPLTTHQIGKAGVPPWKNDPTVPASMVEQEPEGGGLRVKREGPQERPLGAGPEPPRQPEPPHRQDEDKDDKGKRK